MPMPMISCYYIAVSCCHRPINAYLLNGFIEVSLAARVAAIVADGIALLVTWKNTISNVREASCLRINVPLGKALARDGELRLIFDQS